MNMETPDFAWKRFEELDVHDLYNIWKLRQRVFVVEKNFIFDDADGLDPKAIHIMGIMKKQLVAYARIIPPGLGSNQTTVSRIVVHPRFRGQGFARMLIEECVYRGKQRFKTAIRISNQEYLREFYEQFGFQSTGEFYEEDGVPHMEMIKI